jgi:hypothetical protein
MLARIFSPPRNAMQSGKGKVGLWFLEYVPETPRSRDPLMGWTSSADMNQQVRLRFESREQAIAYAEKQGIAYQVMPEPVARSHKKSYSENFRWGRTENWTH